MRARRDEWREPRGGKGGEKRESGRDKERGKEIETE